MAFLLNKVPRVVLVLVLLAIYGMIRSPFEERIRERMVAADLLLPPPAQDTVEHLSQSAFMATLGGLRSIVATYVSLGAFEHFSNKEWDELRNEYRIITSLEPRDETHWVSVVWHLGINAAANMEIDDRIPMFERRRRFNEYVTEAVELAKKGIAQIPDSAAIRMQVAEVYREKLKDPCATAQMYKETIGLPGAPGYAIRFYGYFLADCPGHEQEAYDHLMMLYRGDARHYKGTLITKIKELEEKLNIPTAKRIPDTARDVGRGSKRRANPDKDVLPGGIILR